MVNVVYLIIMFSGISGITWLADLFPDGLKIGILKSVSSKESKIRELERTLKRFKLKEAIYHIVKGNGISVGQAMGIAESVLIQCEALQLPPEFVGDVLRRKAHPVPIDGLEKPDIVLDVLRLVGVVEFRMLAVDSRLLDELKFHAREVLVLFRNHLVHVTIPSIRVSP